MNYDESGSMAPSDLVQDRAESMVDAFSGVGAGVASWASAAGKGFFISERGGQAMLEAVVSFRDKLVSMQQDMASLKQAPQLGNTPGAQLVGPHVQRSADSLDRVVRGLKGVMNDLETGIRKAMATYESADKGSAQTVKGADDA
jgi:hypothetical protein